MRPELSNLGGIEGNADKLVVRRLKGCSRSGWLDSIKAMLVVCRHNEELRQGVFISFMKSSESLQQENVHNKKIDYGEWMQADIPAFHLCHSGRFWKKVLKDIVHPKRAL